MTEYTHLFRVPARFATDHAERGLPTGTLVKANRSVHTYRCTTAQVEEWLSDAVYYSEAQGFDFPDQRIVIASARRTAFRAREWLAKWRRS